MLYYISSWIDPGIYVPGHKENLNNQTKNCEWRGEKDVKRAQKARGVALALLAGKSVGGWVPALWDLLLTAVGEKRMNGMLAGK